MTRPLTPAEAHTPGPYRIEEGDGGAFTIFDEAHCVLAGRNCWPGREDESWATGNLLAAAPDLYEALDDMRNAFTGYATRESIQRCMEKHNVTTAGALQTAVFSATLLALSKARGEPTP